MNLEFEFDYPGENNIHTILVEFCAYDYCEDYFRAGVYEFDMYLVSIDNRNKKHTKLINKNLLFGNDHGKRKRLLDKLVSRCQNETFEHWKNIKEAV